jgi:hypothetical protein
MKKIIWLIVGIIVIVLLFFLIKNDKPTEFNKVQLDNFNLIANRTYITYYDTISKIGLTELGIQGVTIIFKPMGNDKKIDSNYHLMAYIIGKENQFVINISDLNKLEAIDIISHELIHLEQIRNSQLIKHDGYVIWNGVEYPNDLDYSKRPWENDAFSRGKTLSYQIKEILIEK